MKRNIKLIVEYDGTDFVGWQRQPNGRSVQEEIENAILKITQDQTQLTGAGRTDSGVHARGQVANFFLSSLITEKEIHRSLNGVLPEDIVVHSVENVDEQFSARHSAKEREYQYFISKRLSAIDRKYCWQLGYTLDIAKMNEIASSILGIHDFQSFSKTDTEVDHFRSHIFESVWYEKEDKLIYRVRANRFLYGMVRALVGTMVNVGRGFTQVNEFQEIINSKNRSKAGQAAPSKGLFFERVIY
ncbi:MAG TPA: tRNA pseudouridine(38-40) synthase TruA [Bacteroidetes bacterium]|nr:tRNA pseudouridine(38-40) synthase TruA [Bacteroidota bacterium]